MFKKFSLQTKYSFAFAIVIISLLLVDITGSQLNKSAQNHMLAFNQNVTPALSAILNADRDLYQAKVAILRVIFSADTSERAEKQSNRYQENAKQAYDRMKAFESLMAPYPNVLSAVSDFDSAFNKWKISSDKLLSLVGQNKRKEAKQLSETGNLVVFNQLRDIYDAAGEAVDAHAGQLAISTEKKLARQSMLIAIATLVIVVFVAIFAYLGPKMMSRAIKDISVRIRDISKGNGDLTLRVESLRQDELGELAEDINHLIQKLNQLIGSSQKHAHDLSSSVETVSQAANESCEISTQQSQQLESVVTAVNQMSTAIREVASYAVNTATEVSDVNQQTEQGQKLLQQSLSATRGLSDKVSIANQAIQQLSENSNEIASVLDVIRGIAEQTNLLALNAAIEAARAGEQGRGFAVVADEVRSLAAKTQQSTETIQQMISSLHQGVANAVTAINESAGSAETTMSLAQQASLLLNEIGEATQRVSDMSSQTATATEQQSAVTEDINKSLTLIDQQTRENREVIEASKQKTALAKQVSDKLNEEMARFKVSG